VWTFSPVSAIPIFALNFDHLWLIAQLRMWGRSGGLPRFFLPLEVSVMHHGVVRRWSVLILSFTFLSPVCVRGQEVTAQVPSSAEPGVKVMHQPREERLTGTLTVQKLAQTITFGALANKIVGDPDFNVSATASSGLAVSFAASGNCSVTGSTVHISGAGSCTITASQAGNSTYNPAADVPQSFSILTSGMLPASGWRALYVDCQAADCGNYGATNAFDSNNGTMWITAHGRTLRAAAGDEAVLFLLP
jgi:hypothetical protein